MVFRLWRLDHLDLGLSDFQVYRCKTHLDIIIFGLGSVWFHQSSGRVHVSELSKKKNQKG